MSNCFRIASNIYLLKHNVLSSHLEMNNIMYYPTSSDEDYDDDYENYLNDDYDDYDNYDDISYGEDSMDDMEIFSEKFFKEKNHQQHCINILEGLNMDRKSGDMCDGLLCIDGKDFPVHKVILVVASPYFRAMFSRSFDESRQKRIEIKDINKEAFEVVLDYIYGETGKITEENLVEVYNCADMLCVDSVLKECKDYLRFNWSSNFSDKSTAFVLAKRMDLKSTTDDLIDYFHHEFEKIVQEPYFLEMPYEALHRLVEKKQASGCFMDSVVQAVVRWICHKTEIRFAVAREMLGDIHVDQMSNIDELTSALSGFHLEDGETATERDALVSKLKSTSMEIRKKLTDLKLKLRCIWKWPEVAILEFRHDIWDWTEHNTGVEITENSGETKQKFVTEELHCAAVVRDEVMVFGTSSVHSYNLVTKTTKALQHLPQERTNFSVVTHHDTVYVVGGNVQETLRYDAISDSWLQVATWYSPRSSAGVTVHNNTMYMVGGYNAQTLSTSTYFISYNLVNRRFIRLPKLNHAVHNPRVAGFKGVLYVFGQEALEDFMSVLFRPKEAALCQIYNIVKRTWKASSVKISSNESVLDAKSVEEGILLVLKNKEGIKITVSLYRPDQDRLECVACLPLAKQLGMFNHKNFCIDVS